MSDIKADVPSQIEAIDLFCGVGGLTHGLELSGIKVAAGIDIDADCKFPYETNNSGKFIKKSIKDITGAHLRNLFGKARFTLLAGCPPCQPFSTYSHSGRTGRENRDWQLVANFGRLVNDVRPDFVAMENVPRVGQHRVYRELLRHLNDYHVSSEVIECSNFGIPQTRKRLVLLASRLGSEGLALSPLNRKVVTVRETISKLSPLKAGETDDVDPLHTACRLSPLNLKRIRASKQGGTWRDWDPALRAKCHRKKTGNTYPSVYGRMSWDLPSPTITTQCFGYGNGRFGHPQQDRAISLREAALLQTFPANYEFQPPHAPVKFNRLGRLIGNAVPVHLGTIIGCALVRHAKLHSKLLVGK